MPKRIEGPIVTTMSDGQPYVDEPVVKAMPVYCAKEPMTGEVFSHYRRVPLRWMKPDGKGGLVPRES